MPSSVAEVPLVPATAAPEIMDTSPSQSPARQTRPPANLAHLMNLFDATPDQILQVQIADRQDLLFGSADDDDEDYDDPDFYDGEDGEDLPMPFSDDSVLSTDWSGDDSDDDDENVDPNDPTDHRTPLKNALKTVRSDDTNRLEEQVLAKVNIPALRRLSTRVADSTGKDYSRSSLVGLVKEYADYVVRQKLVTSTDQIFNRPLPDTPWFIILWIHDKCDPMDTNSVDYPAGHHSLAGFGHAEKMRAALKHHFGTSLGCGRSPWRACVTDPSRFEGNPAVHDVLDDYLASLKRRKVGKGEKVSQSSRAMTEVGNHRGFHFFILKGGQDILLKLYDRVVELASDAKPEEKSWCHLVQQLERHAIDTLGFQCMFRMAEILHIRWEDVSFLSDDQGKCTIAKIVIRTRKNAQFGGIEPYYIHLLPKHQSHLCPFRALCHYVAACRHTTGYLFRSINARGQITQLDRRMSSSHYLSIMRRSFRDIGLDPALFGTHMLQRGGVQYHQARDRTLTHICLMGGWSTDYSSSSVWRYLAAIVDLDGFDRKNFLNPAPPPKKGKCFQCGRSCSWTCVYTSSTRNNVNFFIISGLIKYSYNFNTGDGNFLTRYEAFEEY
ncbi:hypothetical protein DFH07DRAFT_785357 [Mycena maculata]|uniref:Uncharacterized protein n=1 Tax=Mycena maculata TaxID=230809 RepID=A0AAD7HB37_9AGAR|nr:hypothetical protein DFH07DRAFT_785357 [Mycena maculata]